MNEESIFSRALEIQPGFEREQFLELACHDDPPLRKRIEELLDQHENPDSIFRAGASRAEDATTAAERETDAAAERDRIGNYRLLHVLGEGGMGTIYLAEQQQPVRRRVAVKVIKHGMNTRQFIVRFEAERQALAMMDHPSIAKVLDAGCTEDGRPYFVMELVKGIPITEFCDQNRLSTTERLELFVQVCHAVQHAHQKGIIHRDLKPSNVLVAMYDNQPVPKVIDFGVAKATHQPLTEHTLCTIPGQIVGTWEYMSPEQAILNQLDVDTRTDIYSLGVILYELLTGKTPLDLKSLKPEALEERLRRIREEEPSRPSLRVSSLGQAAAALATYRNAEAAELARTLKGDLDWIVMKALEKDRAKRYDTASGFTAEIGRYLNDEPLSFRPPSSWEQLGRFYRNNKAVARTVAVVASALILGLCLALWGMGQAWTTEEQLSKKVVQLDAANRKADAKREEALQSKRVADHERQKVQLLNTKLLSTNREYEKSLIEICLLYAVHGDLEKVDQLLGSVSDEVFPIDWKLTLKGITYVYRGENHEAIEPLRAALAKAPDNVSARAMLTLALNLEGQWDEWAFETEKLIECTPRPDYKDFDELFLGYVWYYHDLDESVKRIEQVVKEHPTWLMARAMLASALAHQAEEEGDSKIMLRSLQENQLPELLLGKSNPFTLANCFYVHRTALLIFGNSDPKVANAAREYAARLGEYPSYPVGNIVRSVYYDAHDMQDEALEAWRALLQSGRGMHLHWVSAGMLKHNREMELYDVDFSRWKDPEALSAFAYALAWSENENHRRKAWEIYHSLVPKAVTKRERFMVIQIPLLLQDKKVALEQTEKWTTASAPEQVQNVWGRDGLDFIIDENKAIEARDSTNSRERAFANMQLALIRYAGGDYEKAIEYIDECDVARMNRYWMWYRDAFRNRIQDRLADRVDPQI